MSNTTMAVETYTERAAQLSVEAQQARLADDAQKYSAFKTEMASLEKVTVKAANITRELGLSFAEYYLPGKRESAEVYFNQHYRPLLRMSYEVFLWIISAARKLPEKISCMEHVWPGLQLTFFAGELIDVPERTSPQTSQAKTPYVFFFQHLRGLQSELDKRLSDVREWDEETKSGILEEMDRAEKWLETAKAKLQGV
jgi:hypothetical protein